MARISRAVKSVTHFLRTRIRSRSLYGLGREMFSNFSNVEISSANDVGLPSLPMIESVSSNAVISSIKSRFVSLSVFQCRWECCCGTTGENSSGKVRRFSFCAIAVRRLAFALLISVQVSSFFFAMCYAFKKSQRIV